MRRPGLKKVALVAWIATTPLLVFATLSLLANLLDVCFFGFEHTFEIHNGSGELISVKPIGTIGPEGSRYVLLECTIDSAFRRSYYTLKPGTSVRMTYDWDDIQFSEILVRGLSGQWKVIVVDPAPTQNQYSPPSLNKFVVPALQTLPDAPRNVIVADGNYHRLLGRLFAEGLVPILLFMVWRSV